MCSGFTIIPPSSLKRKIYPNEIFFNPAFYDRGMESFCMASDLLDVCWEGEIPVNPLEIGYRAGLRIKVVSGLKCLARVVTDERGKRVWAECGFEQGIVLARIAAAHSLGHLALGHRPHEDKIEAFNSNARGDQVAANIFASVLLMPEAFIRENGHRGGKWLASTFGVPLRFLSLRLKIMQKELAFREKERKRQDEQWDYVENS